VQECEASLALVAVVGEKEKVAPALAMGAVRVGGAGVRGITCLGGSVGGEGNGSTSIRHGGRCVWAVQECEASLALVAVLLVMGRVGAARRVVYGSWDWWARRGES
jgi:hypothetical protein